MAENTNNSSKFSTIFLTLLLVGMSFVAGSLFTNLRADKNETPSVPTAPGAQGQQEVPTVASSGLTQLGRATGNFIVLDEDVCLNDQGLPIVYYFGSSGCPHCKWEHPVVVKAMEPFANVIDFRDRMDSQDDMNVFMKYQEINNGGIPFLALGCRYVRVGSGEREGEAAEIESLTALVCKLTDNQPASVCASVADLVDSIQ